MKTLLKKLNEFNIKIDLLDDKLDIQAPKGVMTQNILNEIQLNKKELIEFITLYKTKKDRPIFIPKVPEQSSYALSSSQRRLWLLSQFEGGNVAYNMPNVFELEGKLAIPSFQSAFLSLIERHESLRTLFKENESGEVSQVILNLEDIQFQLQYEDLSKEANSEVKIKSIIQEEAAYVFDLSADSLLRAKLVRTSQDVYVFICVMHHIISDGWSSEIMTNELFELYDAHVKGNPNPLPELKIQYKDYSAWQQEQLKNDNIEVHKSYWLQQFNGDLPVLDLPSYQTRPLIKTYNGNAVKKLYNESLLNDFNELCQSQGSTLFMGLLTAVKVLLFRYSNHKDIVIGSPIAGREHVDLQNQIGFYVNTLALRTQFEADDSFKELLTKVKEVTLGAYEHQIFPFDELVEYLPLNRDTSRNPLFDVMVTVQNDDLFKVSSQKEREVKIKGYQSEEKVLSKFDLEFAFKETAEGLGLTLIYNTDIYSKYFAENILSHFEVLLHCIIAKSEVSVGLLDYLTASEKHKVLSGFNDTEAVYPKDKTIIDLFEEQVQKAPNNVAVVFEETELTYQELDEQTNQFASYLRKNYAIQSDDLIGIKLERSEKFIIAILGVLKAGAAYVPIDINYPKERIAYMEKDSNCKVVIDQEELERFDVVKEKYSHKKGDQIIKNDDLVYVIYTSGSTGTPKGIMMEHVSMFNLIVFHNKQFQNSDVCKVLQFTSISFDVSFQEIFTTLTRGAALYPVKEIVKTDSNELSAFIKMNNIDTVFLPTSYFKILIDVKAFYDLLKSNLIKNIIVAGEQLILSNEAIDKIRESDTKLHNHYGPAETHVVSTITIKDNYLTYNPPIGCPISNTQIYILDENLQSVAIGVTGKIYISGTGVSRGYLNKPELTKEKFIANPFKAGERMYDTGDLGCWLSDGNIEFLGRKDHQVKIRGYRIELGEIENVILQYSEDLNQVIVETKEVNGEKVLVAYLVSSTDMDKSELRSFLQEKLPDYMVPSFYPKLDKIPLTTNGKIDRKALPSISGEDIVRKEYIAPRSWLEKKLAEIWQEVLGIQKIGVTDNFFESGGHSIKATHLVSMIHKELGIKIRISNVFEARTIVELSKTIEVLNETKFTEIEPVPKQESYPTSSSQRRLWAVSQFEGAKKAYNISGIYILTGNLNRLALMSSFKTLIERHESLRTLFKAGEEGEPRQYIISGTDYNFNIDYHDFRKLESKENELKNKVSTLSETQFNLAEGPLLKVDIIQLEDEKWVCSCILHHLISDGLSMEILIKELFLFYNIYVNGDSKMPNPLRIHYKDYVTWQNKQLEEQVLRGHEDYWIEQFKGDIPILNLLGDKARPKIKTYNGAIKEKIINASSLNTLKKLFQEEEVTLFMGLQAIVNTLLYKYTSDEDIIIGSQMSGRVHTDLESQIGLYINVLPLRTRFKGVDRFRELLQNVKKGTLEAFEHQLYPFDLLIDNLKLKHDISRNPLFDVTVVLQNADLDEKVTLEKMGDLDIQVYKECELNVSRFDLSFNFIERQGELLTTIVFNTDIFNEFTINQLLQHFEKIVEVISEKPECTLDQINILTQKETEKILEDFNDTAIEFPNDKNIIELFKEQVKNDPHKNALVFNGEMLTYSELDYKSDQLAVFLKQNFDLKKEDLIGIALDRSHLYIVAILGILKSGAAYVPIDPDYPKARQEYIISDTAIKILITQTEYLFNYDFYQGGFFAIDVQLNDIHIPNNQITSNSSGNDLAYVMYTSGSTGIPKGVMVEQKSIVRLIKSMNYVNIDAEDNILSLSNFAFDGSVFDIFGSLLNGATLHIPLKECFLDYEVLGETINHNKISIFFLTTALFNSLVDINFSRFDSLKYVLFGGERVSVSHVKQFKERYNQANLVHVYGPTENTTFSSFYNVEQVVDNTNTIPIGKGISNSECYILNHEDYKKTIPPIGVVGEIYVGGVGLSRGYLNNPEMTAEKFVLHPYKSNTTIYKTGDLGRWLPDGSIEFIGRLDDQVKIRGHRIELGEIENILSNHEDLVSCIVIARETKNKDNELVAYYTSKAKEIPNLPKYLKEQLPDYMIPKYFICLEALPLNSNGKVDKKELPITELDLNLEKVVLKARNETEAKLVEIWKEILDFDQISITDDFFDLGGHSLKVTRLISQLHKEFDVKIELKKLFETTILQDQAMLIDNAVKSDYYQIPKVEEQSNYPLSSSQKRLWILSQFEDANTAYNMPAVFEFTGTLNYDSLTFAFESLIERHENLRTVFKENKEGEARQYILSAEDVDFEVTYKNLQEVTNKKQTLAAYIKNDVETNFNLESGLLLKASIYQIEDDKWIFSYVMHHIISDGWSMDILIKELLETYDEYNKGVNIEKEALKIQYKDYAVWQQNQFKEGKLELHKKYWLKQFEGELPVLQLPEDKPRPLVQTYNGKIIQTKITADVTEKLKYQTNQEGATLFISLLTIVKILLCRYTNSQDIIIGCPIANREHADLEDQIGFYLNTLALRTQFDSTNSFKELFQLVKQNTLEAYKYQAYPFDELINDLKLRRDMSKNALFDVMVVLQNATNNQLTKNKEHQIEGLHISDFQDFDYEVSKFDLSFNFLEVNDEIEASIEYNSDIYTQETAQRMLQHLEQVILSVIENPDIKINDIDILTTTEKKLLLEKFSSTDSRNISKKTVIQEFENTVLKYPENKALLFDKKYFTYQELNEKANQLAHYLKEKYAVGSDILIGIELERSEWLLISMLAILKTGSAYLPIDTEYPKARIEFIKSDSFCSCIIDEFELLKFEQDIDTLKKNNLERDINNSDLAYTIYTSGTTGNPKGVMVEHSSVLDYCSTFIETFKLNELDTIIQQSSISFDTHVEEIYPALMTGATILMGVTGGRDIKEIQYLIEEENATVLSSTPLIIKALNESEFNVNKLRLLISGGDKLNRNYVSKFLYTTIVYDTYGPSESTVCSAYYKINNISEKCIIGKPITNRTITITNNKGLLQPIGIIGEIRISGSGLARGYKNQSQLTSEKFITSELLGRTYKTGDLGKWLPDGNIEFIGRQDDQVKIRGYRIELGEVENSLQNHPAIESAAVLVALNNEGIKELAAYFVVKEELNVLDIRRYLNKILPDYMIPSKYIKIDKMPLNTNGKIEKKALHEQNGTLLESGISFAPARNEIEIKITQVWKDLLEKESIGIYDNFFDLGGESLKTTRLINKINELFLVKIKIKKIFEDPTISGISEHVKFMLQQKELSENKELQEINID
nr:non-ribosomal peptide synthetase [uncultured Flavobacterium sp.]